MNSVGERLRAERMRRGLELGQIAQLTKISARYLEAIEESDFQSLPGRFFARSFLRQYAQVVGVDEREIQPELEKLAEPKPPLETEAPAPVHHKIQLAPIEPGIGHSGFHKPPVAGPVLALVLMVAACSVIYVMWENTRRPATEVATQQVAADPAHASASTREAPARPAPPKTGTAPSSQPAAAAPVKPASQAPPALAAAAPAEPTPVAANAAAVSRPIHIGVGVTERAWVRASADGKILYDGILDPVASPSKSFEAAQSLKFMTGNARAVSVDFNGKPLGPLGRRGEFLTVVFTPANYDVIRTQAPESNPDSPAQLPAAAAEVPKPAPQAKPAAPAQQAPKAKPAIPAAPPAQPASQTPTGSNGANKPRPPHRPIPDIY